MRIFIYIKSNNIKKSKNVNPNQTIYKNQVIVLLLDDEERRWK